MLKIKYPLIGFLIVISLLVAACGTAEQPSPGTIQEETSTVGVPVTGLATATIPALPTVAATEAVPGGTISTLPVPTGTTGAAPAQTAAATVPAPRPEGYGETLQTIQSRGNVVCGINGQLPGFSFLDPQGNYTGFDVDFCRALAAAIFGDPNRVEYRSTTTQERFTVLQTGEVDVLIRNTTWSLARDTELGLNFTGVTFYDGQGIMVPVDTGISTLDDLDGGTICVQKGTTTELNLADAMATAGVNYTPAVFDDVNATYGAYAEGRCDAATSDKSQLSSVARAVLPDPDNHVILDLTLSKEPLGPVVRHGDDQWLDIVKWVVFATIAGEEYEVNMQNVDDVRSSSQDPEVRRLLGVEGDMGLKLGLTNDWAYNVIKQVGNYADIYNRNLGEDTATSIPRGLNNLFTADGLLYSPPFR